MKATCPLLTLGLLSLGLACWTWSGIVAFVQPRPLSSNVIRPTAGFKQRSRTRLGAAPRSRSKRRLDYDAGHYSKWRWATGDSVLKVNYVRKGNPEGRKLVLVHGFGGSAYHWRHNILALADAGFDVYAVDLLGFGRSEKPLVNYSIKLWSQQLEAFIEEIVCSPVVLIGNSLGAFASLKTAAERRDLVTRLALLNGAGPFRDAGIDDDRTARLRSQLLQGGENTLLALGRLVATGAPLPEWARMQLERLLVSGAFLYLRTPQRVREILESLYPASSVNVDDELVSSILMPAYHPNAMEVYYRLVSSTGQGNAPRDFADALCERLEQPLLLLWGDCDPWVKTSAAEKLEEAYRGDACTKVFVRAGHCPMDELPLQVNEVLLSWLS